jgi:ribosomal protein S18 acetylase RimI-like enzyme
MKFRNSMAKDSDEILAILYENSRWLDSLGVFQWPFEWMKSQEDRFIKEIEQGSFVVYQDSALIAGIMHVTEEPDPLWEGIDGTALYLSKIAVRRSRAGESIGTHLIDYGEKLALARGIGQLRLDFVSSNGRLKDYYVKRCFSFVARRKLPAVALDLYVKELEIESGPRE